jgi:hypothetical protein
MVTALEGRLDLDVLSGATVTAPRFAGATFAVVGSLFVVAVAVVRIVVARTAPAARVAGATEEVGER